MGGVGQDIKEVLRDVGVKIRIIRSTGNLTGEYLKYTINAQVTKPFIREFFLDAIMSFDTDAISGDIIEVIPTSSRYILMNRTPYTLENEVIQYNSVLYKTNVKIDVERPVEIRSDQTYLTRTTWEKVKSNVDALLTSPLFGVTLETEELVGLLGIDKGEMYVPTSYGIQRLDRIRITGTREYYRVEAVKPRRFEDIDVLDVGEDTRPGTTTTTTSSTTTSTSTTTTTTTA